LYPPKTGFLDWFARLSGSRATLAVSASYYDDG